MKVEGPRPVTITESKPSNLQTITSSSDIQLT